MNKNNKSIRGMHDFLPEDVYEIVNIEKIIKNILKKYCYSEIRFPVLEKTSLFTKTIGYETDIVKKEMYNFYDYKKNSLSLRPEGTIGCIRTCLQHGIFRKNKIQKLWYLGPMFRYERPQKGRFRQFSQFGFEFFGSKSYLSEFELIIITYKIWKEIGIINNLVLEINSIGSIDSRKIYINELKNFFKQQSFKLNKNLENMLLKNPFRLLDNKNLEIKKIIQKGPLLKNFLDMSSIMRFKKLCILMDSMNIPYIVNDQLVRGLDYYNDTVFEWKTELLGTQGTVCAGGRYDYLTTVLGGEKNSAVGCAIGIDRLFLLKKFFKKKKKKSDCICVSIIFTSNVFKHFLMLFSEKLHSKWPQLKIFNNFDVLKISSQIKKSLKIGANFLIILDSREFYKNKIIIKNLKEKSQKNICFSRVLQNPCIFV